MKKIFWAIIFISCNQEHQRESLYYSTGEKHIDVYKKNNDYTRFEYFFKNGNIEKIIHEYKGKREGEAIFYYENGKIAQKENYQDGKINGDCYLYSDDGTLVEKAVFKMDKKMESYFYYPNGNIKTHQVFYKDSLPYSISKFSETGERTYLYVLPVITIEKEQYEKGEKIKVFYKLPIFEKGFNYELHIGLTSKEKMQNQDFSGEKIIPVLDMEEKEVLFDCNDKNTSMLYAFVVIKDTSNPKKQFDVRYISEEILIL